MNEPPGDQTTRALARTGPYAKLLATAALLGVPISLAAFGFLALLHGTTALVWEHLPDRLGFASPPWWWPLPWLLLAGVLVGAAVTRLPGRGGHTPIDGLDAAPAPPAHLPGILLAALAGLPLGAVLGPEAPLLALGAALATLLTRSWGPRPGTDASALLAVSGSAAALAVIFGSPLIAAVFVLETAGFAGPKLSRIVLPCLLASGVGALVFTGMGAWTGVSITSLRLPGVDGPARPDLGDLLWTIPVAVAIAVAVRQIHRVGHRSALLARRRPMRAAVAAAALTAACAAAYSLTTGRSPAEVALSGQETLARLAADPAAWTTGALVALLLLKGLAYGACLGALRGGPVFPALFLGAAAGVLAGELPGYGTVPGMAAGMAAATAAVLPYPVSAAVLVTVLLGADAAAMTPIILIAVVVAYVSEQLVARKEPT